LVTPPTPVPVHVPIIKPSFELQNDKPLLIYIIGNNDIPSRSYLCTFLYQIEFYKKYCGIENNRINLFYGENGKDDNDIYENTCENVIEVSNHNKGQKSKLHKPIPFGIDVTYINENYSINNLFIAIRNILTLKANSKTPIIFLYDCHGFTGTESRNGYLIMDKKAQLTISEYFLNISFKNYELNKKLFLFSQC
jgi:hypothetical protein